MANNASSVLSVARGEIGYSRWNDPQTGTKYGRWYADIVGNRDFAANGVAYCAMFVSWVFAQAGATSAGLPGAYCPTMLANSRQAGAVLSDKTKAKPGDIVYFDWDGGVVDHVGIVEINQGSYIQTIEGNTNNGQVARRTRSWGTVAGVVRPSYGSTASNGGSTSKPATGDSSASSGNIDEDGYWGPATTRKLQEVLGAPYVDGEISRQYAAYQSKNPGLCGGWEWLPNGKNPGSQTIRIMQEKMGISADGFYGPDTANALIKRYMSVSGASICDGKLDGPSMTIKAMQRALNRGEF